MASSTWFETTADAASVTHAAVVGSTHFVSGLHVALMSDVDSSDVPEAATVVLKDGGTTIFNSALVSNTDDSSAYGYGTWGGYPTLHICFPHPLEMTTGKLVTLVVAGISSSLSSDAKRKINLWGYTEVDKVADDVVSGTDKTYVHVNPGTSDGTWWRS
jgi:hypothetical protein